MTNQGIHSWQTNQLCYVARGVKKLILSKETCTKLGMLSISFPAVGCKNDVDFDPSLSVPELLKKIIKHYAASVFNRCTRKTMPLMKGKPLPIPVRKDAKPVAASSYTCSYSTPLGR